MDCAETVCPQCGYDRSAALDETSSVCPNCGGTSLAWGKLHGPGEGAAIRFTPEDASWFAQAFGLGGASVVGRARQQCGHIALFISR
jgi:hypothetical protein